MSKSIEFHRKSEEIISFCIDTNCCLILCELIGNFLIFEIFCELLNPMVVVEEEFERQIIVSEDYWVKMAQIQPFQIELT